MKRRTININGVTISYLEANEEKKQTIFFLHGNSNAGRIWHNQLDSNLLIHNRLIAFDLPGHGESDPLPLKDYNILKYAFLISKAISELALGHPYLVVGFSMGTNLCAELLAQGAMPNGIILAGSSVFGCGLTLADALNYEANSQILFQDQTSAKDFELELKSWCHTKNIEDFKAVTEDFSSTKEGFRSALFNSAIEGKFSDEIQLLKKYPNEILVVFGANDGLNNNSYLDKAGLNLWNHKVFRISGSSHYVQLDQPEKFNLLLNDYADFAFKDTHV